MAEDEDRENLALDALFYATEKALEAVKDMPRHPGRLDAFAIAWAEACKEYIDARRSRMEH